MFKVGKFLRALDLRQINKLEENPCVIFVKTRNNIPSIVFYFFLINQTFGNFL